MGLTPAKRLNLASFVTTWMEPECEKLIHDALNVNYVDTMQVRRPCVRASVRSIVSSIVASIHSFTDKHTHTHTHLVSELHGGAEGGGVRGLRPFKCGRYGAPARGGRLSGEPLRGLSSRLCAGVCLLCVVW